MYVHTVTQSNGIEVRIGDCLVPETCPRRRVASYRENYRNEVPPPDVVSEKGPPYLEREHEKYGQAMNNEPMFVG